MYFKIRDKQLYLKNVQQKRLYILKINNLFNVINGR